MLHSKPTPSDCNFITSYNKSGIANDKCYYYSASESVQIDNIFYDWKLHCVNFETPDKS